MHSQGVQELVLVAPVWKAQAWYPMLLQMLARVPILILQSPDTIQPVCQNDLPDIIPQLAVWVISNNSDSNKPHSLIIERQVEKIIQLLFQ